MGMRNGEVAVAGKSVSGRAAEETIESTGI